MRLILYWKELREEEERKWGFGEAKGGALVEEGHKLP
jgi:hypothetical protein